MRAPEVFASLRQDVARVEAGLMTACDALAPWMSDDDRMLLEQVRESVLSWVDSALYHLAEPYGEIPQDIVTRFTAAARR